jgi:hypothetical protein
VRVSSGAILTAAIETAQSWGAGTESLRFFRIRANATCPRICFPELVGAVIDRAYIRFESTVGLYPALSEPKALYLVLTVPPHLLIMTLPVFSSDGVPTFSGASFGSEHL